MNGPWSYRSRADDDWGVIRDASGHVVATCSLSGHSEEELAAHRSAGTDPTEATALRIAAVPDLIGALRAAHNLYMFAAAGAFANGVTDASGTIDEGEARAAEIAATIRAALSKAEPAGPITSPADRSAS